MDFGGPWPIRVAWLVQPLALNPILGDALDPHSTPVQALVLALAWAGWTTGLVAVLVPRTVGLTAVRILAPAGSALAMWAAVVADGVTWGAVAVVASAVTATIALSPTTGDVFVNGSAYGAERRFALRPPAVLSLGPVQLIWALVVAGTVAGPLLLAAEQWIAGLAVTVVGVSVAALGCRSLHQLSRRWLVMVPAGVVIHDPAAVVAQLFRSPTVASIGPAPADSGALDLTAGAPGLALELQLLEAATLELRKRGSKAKVVHATAVMFTPSRPGEVLREAADRSLVVR